MATHTTVRRRGEKSRAISPVTPHGRGSGFGLLDLQRVAGNRAVVGLLRSASARARLPVQRSADSEQIQHAAKVREIRRMLGNPEHRPDRAITIIEEAGIKVLLDVGEFSSKERVRHLAASDSGRRILVAARRRFDKAKQYSHEMLIGAELDRRAEPAGTAVVKSTQDKIDALNEIIEGEDSFQRMLYNDWLKLPVTVYRSGYEEDGGVYYNPSLSGPTTLGKKPKSVPAGKTEAEAWKPEPEPDDAPGVGEIPRRVPLIYIQIGPSAFKYLDAATDDDARETAQTYLRSVLYHEFQHFLDNRKLRDTDALSDDELAGITLNNNAETRAYASQLWKYYSSLSQPQISELLTSMSEYFPSANADVQQYAAALIAAAVAHRDLPGTMAHEEFLSMFDGLDGTAQSALAPIAERVRSVKRTIDDKQKLWEQVAR